MSKAAELALLIGSQSQGNTIGHRNMILNGDLMIDQKGETATQTGSGGAKPVDGWRQGQSNVGQLSVETSRTADAPSNTQLKHSLKAQVKTVESSLGASEDCTILTKVEGHDCQKLMYGTANAKNTVLSFWVKSSIAGTFSVNIYQEDGNDAIAKPYTISSADTWEYKTISYPGNTSAAITDDATCGLQISWYIAAGSNNVGGSNGDVWHGYTANKFAFGHVTNTHVTTDESTFQLTGVQFEIGNVATPYEFKSYEEKLARCQRWFYTPVAKGGGNHYFSNGWMYDGSNLLGLVFHPVQMRANPTVVSADGTNYFSFYRNGTADHFNDVVLNAGNNKSTSIINANDISGTAGHSGGMYVNDGTNAYFWLDAWL